MRMFKTREGVYQVSFRSTAGKTKTLTTRCTNEADAKKVVQDAGVKDLELAARSGRLTNEAISHITTGRKITLTKAVPQFEVWMKSIGRSPRTVASEVLTVNQWLGVARIENLPPAAVTEQHINKFINDPKSTTKLGTRKGMLAAIRTFFSFCQAKGWCVANPSVLVRVDMSAMSHAQKEPKVRECFNGQEVRRLIESADEGFWKFAIKLGYEIGLRLGDICQLEWDCFAVPGRVSVWTDKRDRRVSVPLSDELSELLTQVPVHSSKYLFPEQRKTILDTKRRALLSNQFKRLSAKVGINDKSFHSLRHSFCTRMSIEGKSLEDIAKDVGHSSTKTTKTYIH